MVYPTGVLEDVLVKVKDLIFPADFYVLNMEDDNKLGHAPLILGRPFLKTARTIIKVHEGTLSMEFAGNTIHFNILDSMKYPSEDHSSWHVNFIDLMVDVACADIPDFVSEFPTIHDFPDSVHCPDYHDGFNKCAACSEIDEFLNLSESDMSFQHALHNSHEPSMANVSLAENFMQADGSLDLDTNRLLPSIQQPPALECKPLPDNLKYAYLEEREKLPVLIANNLHPDQEKRLLDLLRRNKRAIGWTLVDIPGISPSLCMHRIHLEEGARPVVPKKTGFTVVANERNELVPMRVQNSWRICIAPEDQEKTTFTCPFGTFAYRRMPFGLCNAPVFMDDFSVYGTSFDDCLVSLGKVLERCVEKNLVLNYEKCHFMVEQGIVLGHVISKQGITVDSAKVDVIASLPYPASVREVRSFLGHAGFYRRFIQDFSKIAIPLSHLLQKDVDFKFDEQCKQAFEELKRRLTSPPIIQPPNWELPFELMSLKFLLKKPDAKPRLIRWMLLLQEFDIEIKDKSGAENLVADHLSRIPASPDSSDMDHPPIKDNFPDALLYHLHGTEPWYADMTNGQAKVSNREIKQILEKTVQPNRKD
ncbi:uncharacterized protein LOC127809310 [Diospyros lotus]|uniref:uncharacterized protein LOC127809310 n=1 Tax=Diospyros lotus TaxID=55363 RepID=UPI0022549479|nr:uncharacterized protein LOC127809310 [Diospyros lotus]